MENMQRLTREIVHAITKSACSFEEVQAVLTSITSINEQAYLKALNQQIEEMENEL